MLTRDGTRLQVHLDLQRRNVPRTGWDEIIILDEHTIERPWGWVFFYNTRASRLGHEYCTIAGNAPYMFNRDGTIRFAGTALSIDEYIREYESELERKTSDL
jgi:hypothetical protein